MKRYRVSREERSRRQRESLSRALQNQALTNYPAIYEREIYLQLVSKYVEAT